MIALLGIMVLVGFVTVAHADISLQGELDRIAYALFHTGFVGYRDNVRVDSSAVLWEPDAQFANAYFAAFLNDLATSEEPETGYGSTKLPYGLQAPISWDQAEKLYGECFGSGYWAYSAMGEPFFTFIDDMIYWETDPCHIDATFVVDDHYDIMGDFGAEIVFGRVVTLDKWWAYVRVTLGTTGAVIGDDIPGLIIEEVKVLGKTDWPSDVMQNWMIFEDCPFTNRAEPNH